MIESNLDTKDRPGHGTTGAISPEDLVMVQEDMEILSRGTAEIISVEDLARKLVRSKKTGVPLKVKLGIDPTAPHVHLGFAVVLRKLRKFQDLGHRVQLVIGNFTAQVGDPSGKSETRKMLTPEEVAANARTYKEQLAIILDPEKTDVSFNADWLEPLNFADILKLTSKFTVARILERDDFTNRLKSGKPLGMHEILYPLMQGYDSVVLESDVEMGGTDQKFNNLVGRDLQREYGQEPQVVILMPILEGTDGVLKMSKSYGNYIGITEPPDQMFGKVMSIPDSLIIRYFELCTDVPMAQVWEYQEKMAQNQVNPRDVKLSLAEEIVSIYHGPEQGKHAREEFLRVFSRKEIPTEMEEIHVAPDKLADGKIAVADLIVETGLAPSKREARRLVQQGAVKIDSQKVENPAEQVELMGKEIILQVGSRRFARVTTGA